MIFIFILIIICLLYLWWLDNKLEKLDRLTDFYYRRSCNMAVDLERKMSLIESRITKLERSKDEIFK